jgi:hypothetical protein
MEPFLCIRFGSYPAGEQIERVEFDADFRLGTFQEFAKRGIRILRSRFPIASRKEDPDHHERRGDRASDRRVYQVDLHIVRVVLPDDVFRFAVDVNLLELVRDAAKSDVSLAVLNDKIGVPWLPFETAADLARLVKALEKPLWLCQWDRVDRARGLVDRLQSNR